MNVNSDKSPFSKPKVNQLTINPTNLISFKPGSNQTLRKLLEKPKFQPAIRPNIVNYSSESSSTVFLRPTCLSSTEATLDKKRR